MIKNSTNNRKYSVNDVESSIHIVLVANTTWSIYNFRLGLVRRLKKEGYQLSIIAPRDQYTAMLVSEGIDCHDLSMNNYGTNPIYELRLYRQLTGIYRRIKPDFIFHYTIKPNIYGSLAANYLGIPSIAVTTGLGQLFKFSNVIVRMASLVAYRLAAKASREMWFLNSSDRDIFVYKNIVKLKNTKILKSEGVDTNWFSLRLTKDYSNNRFLFAGRLIWDKGVKEFVQAASIIRIKYPDCIFEIAGFVDPSNPNSVPFSQLLLWQKKGMIKYLGETSDIRPLLEKATCFVFPSFYREGVSRVLMEAASMETPIITTDNVGCREVVDDNRNGFLIPTRSVDDLVDAMERYIHLSIEDRIIMAKRGRQKMIDEFSENKVLDFYMDVIALYTSVVDADLNRR